MPSTSCRSRCQSTWFARPSGSSSPEPSMRGGVGHVSEVCKESSAFVKSVNTTLIGKWMFSSSNWQISEDDNLNSFGNKMPLRLYVQKSVCQTRYLYRLRKHSGVCFLPETCLDWGVEGCFVCVNGSRAGGRRGGEVLVPCWYTLPTGPTDRKLRWTWTAKKKTVRYLVS